ncbi:hypothetical protein Tco_1325172 [Tanacetum coccineum]
MTNLAKLEFLALDISGKNYLSWVLDAEIHLDANGIGNTIKEGNETSVQDKAKAMIFLRHHLDEALKTEYLTVKDPLVLWKKLKDRYDHQTTMILPRACYEWVHLRLQDSKSVSEYNSAMFRITSQLTLCGEKITDEEMLEKTFFTFHASNMLLQHQYRERVVLVEEIIVVFNLRTQVVIKSGKMIKNDGGGKAKGAIENGCYRYGSINHWARVCRTPKHLVELYQRSHKNKEKAVEINFAYQDEKIDNFDIDSFGIDNLDVDPKDQNDTTHLNVSDFLTNE